MRDFVLSRVIYKPLIVAVAALTTSITATADDLDVFRAMLESQNTPNILLVLDYSGSMIEDIEGNQIVDGTTQSKFDILESAVSSLLENNKGKVNVGLGSTYNWRSSGVRWPISDLTQNANTFDPAIPAADNIMVADVIDSLISRKVPEDATGTVNALAEAAAYFRGDSVVHSDYNRPDQWNVGAQRYEGGDDLAAMPASYTPQNAYDFATDTWTPPKYVSPLTKQCQANFIVLISDGKPTILNEDTMLNTVLTEAGVTGVADCSDLSKTIFHGGANGSTADLQGNINKTGNCGPEIVGYLANNDINPDIEGSNVNTFTVGYAVEDAGKDYLERLAEDGKGEFYVADKPEALTTALNNIIDSILAGSQNFSSLSIDIDPSSFSHGDRAYYSLFSPSSTSGWDGNLKGYFVDDGGLLDITGKEATIKTPSGINFDDAAQSFWSSEVDGNDVMIGGASESLVDLPEGPNDRKIYTYLGGGEKALRMATESRLKSDNQAITNAHMGTATDAERINALNWIANAPMGDPLHTSPIVVSYEEGDVKTSVVYIMTNQGFLHAFDGTKPLAPSETTPDNLGGNELFAFMPEELLSNIPELHSPTNDADHVYGLDGHITRWHNDGNKDGLVNDDETVQLVFGMRRGGGSYYSLDVTDPANPSFNWQIKKGTDTFEKLAQTWSRASLITVKDGVNANDGTDKKKRVLMFAGGYDLSNDEVTEFPKPASGNSVYMVDENGVEVWSIEDTNSSLDDMDYSIASDLTIIDSDRNGIADRAYFGDLGGQVWRVDFGDINEASETVVAKFADVKVDGKDQPIFYAPSISMNKDADGRYLSVAFGTGDRTQPMLEDSSNAFFMLRDRNYKAGAPDVTPVPITASMIYNATENDIGSDVEETSKQAKSELKEASGWVVNLNPGEKALSKVVTYDGKFMATTFEPDIALDDDGNPDPCRFAMLGRLYVMDIADAQPVKLLDDGTEKTLGLDKADRVTDLNGTTIPSKPVVIFPADSSKAQIFVDKESIVSVNKPVTTVFWHAK